MCVYIVHLIILIKSKAICNFFSYEDDDLLFHANVTLVLLDQIIFLKLEINFVRIYILCIKMKKKNPSAYKWTLFNGILDFKYIRL